MNKLKIASVVLLTGIACASVPAFAEEDADEQFSVAVTDFGYAGGAAWQCAEATARAGIERAAMTSYNGLVRLFGSDEAFFFASTFGAGTVDQIDKAKCETFTKQFSDGMKKAGAQ